MLAPDQAMQVNVSVDIRRIISLNEEAQSISLDIFVELEWYNRVD